MGRHGTRHTVDPAGLPAALRGALWLAAFCAGFAVTGIEIALGRLLAPHFGASLTVWAAIIASVVAALSLGYPLGGVLADRRPTPGLPLAALPLAGFAGAALGFAAPHGLPAALAGVGLAGSAYWLRLAGVLALFAVPCVLFASVPPAVLRLTLRERDTAGRDAGWLYALGSLGSVLGVLLPALWWIPLLGLRSTFGLLAAISCAPGLLALASGAWPRRGPAVAAGLLPFALLPLIPAQVSLSPPPGAERVLHDRDSGIQRVRVLAADRPGQRRRWLQLDEGWTTHSWLLEPELATGGVWDWMALSALLPRVDDGRSDVLIVGLAGGTVSNLMTRLLRPLLGDLAITGVEIDPQVIEVADRYLDLDRRALRVVIGDGRVFLRASDARFDLILLDAYAQPSIPAHLATREFFAEVRGHLAPGGLAVLNAFAPAGRSRVLDGLAGTWRAVFPASQVFTGPAFEGFASHLLFGGPAVPLAFDRHPERTLPRALRSAWRTLRARTGPARPSSSADRRIAWTDDRAPVELLTDRAFRALRPPNPPAGSEPPRRG